MCRNTFNISFYCRDSKKDRNGQAHIEMAINVNQKRLFINLPFTIEPEKFNSKRKPKEVEDYISLMRTRVNQIIVDMMEHQEPITSERIREYVRTGGYKSYTVEDMFQDYLSILRKRVDVNLTPSVYRRYELLYEMFRENNDMTIEVNGLTQSMCMDFRNTLLQRYDRNTAVGYMTKFKSFIKYAVNNGKLKTNPAAYVNISREKKEIDYLTEKELNTLKNTTMENQSLQSVLDLFLFEASSGISYADMQLLTKEDIKEENGTYYVSKKRKKTGTEFTAVILPFGVDILKKYDYNLKRISNQKMNAYLKVIGNMAGISKKLHTHLARHTYLSLLLNKGVRLEVCSKAAGHRSTKVTAQFYAQIHKDTVLQEIASVI